MSLLYLKWPHFCNGWGVGGNGAGWGGVEVCGCGANTFLRAIIQNLLLCRKRFEKFVRVLEIVCLPRLTWQQGGSATSSRTKENGTLAVPKTSPSFLPSLTLKMKALAYFETSGATRPIRQRHFPEDMNRLLPIHTRSTAMNRGQVPSAVYSILMHHFRSYLAEYKVCWSHNF